MMWKRLLLLGVVASCAVGATTAFAAVDRPRPVRAVGDQRLVVNTPDGTGQLPMYASENWTSAHPGITRVIVVVQGLNRNAEYDFRSARKELQDVGEAGAHTMIIVPHFLADEDIPAHNLGDEVLHWSWDDWGGGAAANGPIPASSFDAFDAILTRLADKAAYPDLRNVVVAGHSAGAQVVQRYAVVGKGQARLDARGVGVRYVVANPSSYLYFGEARPYGDIRTCPNLNRWRYGFASGVPPYVTMSQADLEKRYIARDVIYLLGTADNNPDHPQLDKSCAAEVQGPFRYARGIGYLKMLKQRNGAAVTHRELDVPGIGHDSAGMFGSACGRATWFNVPGCPGF